MQHKRKIICCQRSKKNSYYVSCVYYVSPPSSQRTISKRIEYQPKSNEKYTGFLHCISSFEDNSCINICKMSHQIFYFLLFYTSLYISRHHFSQIFRTSLNILAIIWEKKFCHKFSFFNRFTNSAKCDERFLLMLP